MSDFGHCVLHIAKGEREWCMAALNLATASPRDRSSAIKRRRMTMHQRAINNKVSLSMCVCVCVCVCVRAFSYTNEMFERASFGIELLFSLEIARFYIWH